MRFNGLVEFEPPSDFVEESGGGGGKRSWFKIVGIGCAGLVLIVGLITAAGVIKGISCCGDLKTAGVNTIGAMTYGMQFTSTIQDGRFDEAHGMMAPEFQGTLDSAGLKAKFSQDWLSEATLLNEGLQGDPNQQVENFDDIKDIQTWDMRMRLYPQEGNTQLVTTVGVKIDEPAEGDTPASFLVYHLDVTEREIDFRVEPPAQAVLGFHGRLQSNDLNRAYSLMNPGTQQGGLPTFQAFIDDQGDLFTKSIMEIEDVRYPRQDAALVTARLSTTSGDKAIVTYQMSPGVNSNGWRIDGISPLLQTDGAEPTVDPGEKIDEDTERVKDDENQEKPAGETASEGDEVKSK